MVMGGERESAWEALRADMTGPQSQVGGVGALLFGMNGHFEEKKGHPEVTEVGMAVMSTAVGNRKQKI